MEQVLIYSNKVASPEYNGQGYYFTKTVTPPSSPLTISLFYNSSGQFSVTFGGNGNLNGNPPVSGTWTTTPGVAYEFYLTGTWLAGGIGSITAVPATPVPVSTWTPISGNTLVARLSQVIATSEGERSVQFTLQVRKIGDASPIITTSFSFSLEYAP